MEIGIYSFVETRFDPATGRQLGVEERLAHLLEEIELADQVGLDVFGIGEHHRADYAVSAPAIVLAATDRSPTAPFVDGGSTRTILRHSPAPVLMIPPVAPITHGQ